MEEKIIKPKAIIYELFFTLLLSTFSYLFIVLLTLSSGDIRVPIGYFLLMIVTWIVLLIGGFRMYHKDHITLVKDKVLIDQVVMEWEDVRRMKPNGISIHQEIEIAPCDVLRIGFSCELYSQYLYYHAARTTLGIYGEVMIVMNDGKRYTFDPLVYSLKQLREIVNALSRNGEIPISTKLEKALRRRFYERKLQ